MCSKILKRILVPNYDEAVERARNGAAYLDAKYGANWDERIDLDRLDIGSPTRCVLGQLIARGYLRASLHPYVHALRYGFSLGPIRDIAAVLPFSFARRPYRSLTEAWKAVIRDRIARREVSEQKSQRPLAA